MNSRLVYGALLLAFTTLGACDDDPPMKRDGGSGGMGGSQADGGAGSGGDGPGPSTDAPAGETGGPSTDGPGSQTDGGPDAAPVSMANVTPAGRRLVSPDGRLTLEILPGAFAGPIEVEITVAASPPAGALGAVYEIQPVGQAMFVPARAIFRYTAEELAGGRPSDLRIGLREGAGWLLLEGTANTTNTTIVADLPRLGLVGLLPGVCTACTPCAPETCQIATQNEMMPMVAGKCLDLPNGCKKCVATCDNDGDGFCPGDPETGEPGNDCADDDPSRYPGAPEVCGNGVDDSCSGRIDDGCQACAGHADCTGLNEACILGICTVCTDSCTGGTGTCTIPDAEEGTMGRCLVLPNTGCGVCVPDCDTDGDGYCPGASMPGKKGGDCNDTSSAVSPAAHEICGNGVDDDCNGSIDDLCSDCQGDDDCGRDKLVCRQGACAACSTECTVGMPCMYMGAEEMSLMGTCEEIGRNDSCTVCVPGCDEDSDGYCSGDQPGGIPGGDCEATNPDVYPTAPEICGNDQDDNCNELVDEGCKTCVADSECPMGNACRGRQCEQCNETCDPAACVFGADEMVPTPGVPGKCVPRGNGCQECVPTCDMDGDGICPEAEPGNEQPGGDCDDGDARVFPDAVELCGNAKDDDCDGVVDDNCAVTTCSMSATCGANATCSTGR
jgi:hypothetical protein